MAQEKGTRPNPYTWDEYLALSSQGAWNGGWVLYGAIPYFYTPSGERIESDDNAGDSGSGSEGCGNEGCGSEGCGSGESSGYEGSGSSGSGSDSDNTGCGCGRSGLISIGSDNLQIRGISFTLNWSAGYAFDCSESAELAVSNVISVSPGQYCLYGEMKLRWSAMYIIEISATINDIEKGSYIRETIQYVIPEIFHER